MTTGEKLAKLRKEHGYTQEDLADILNVSRQSVSKWESDAAYPETDKLIRLGKLYNCSMDYLLQEETTASQASDNSQQQQYSNERHVSIDLFSSLRTFHFERKSKRMIGSLPLWHINIGWGRTAKGVFAVGLSACGIVSVGLLSIGLLSLGVLSIGLLALGVFAAGLVAAGCIALGILAVGAIAVGILSIGAMAIGEFSIGAMAIGKYYAYGDYARAAIAIGKTHAYGSTFSASAVTSQNRSEIMRLLQETTPPLLKWAKNIVVGLMP